MSKSHQSFNKKEKEKKRQKKRLAKLERQRMRKIEKAESGPKSFEDMISYVDENGNFSSTPPDPTKKKVINAEDIELGVPKREEFDPNRSGKVKFFNGEKGYGFITDLGSGEGIFVHVNNIEGHIEEGDKVTFEIAMGPKGQYASNVKIDNTPDKPKPAPQKKDDRPQQDRPDRPNNGPQNREQKPESAPKEKAAEENVKE